MAERVVLDLDALIPDTQYVKLDGKEHEVNPASVDMYLQVMKKRQRIKNADNDVEQMEQAIDLITLACPTIDRARLGRLGLLALTRLADLIQKQMEDSEGELPVDTDAKEGDSGE